MTTTTGGMVSRALPGRWELITPAQALAVRQAGAGAALRDLLGLGADDPVPVQVVAVADGLAGRACAAVLPWTAPRRP